MEDTDTIVEFTAAVIPLNPQFPQSHGLANHTVFQVGDRLPYNIGLLSEDCSKTKKYYVRT
jgi:hypothetical protein